MLLLCIVWENAVNLSRTMTVRDMDYKKRLRIKITALIAVLFLSFMILSMLTLWLPNHPPWTVAAVNAVVALYIFIMMFDIFGIPARLLLGTQVIGPKSRLSDMFFRF